MGWLVRRMATLLPQLTRSHDLHSGGERQDGAHVVTVVLEVAVVDGMWLREKILSRPWLNGHAVTHRHEASHPFVGLLAGSADGWDGWRDT